MGILDAPGVSPAKFRQMRQRDLPFTVRPLEPKAATVLPTVTLGAVGAASAISGGTNTRFTNRGAFNLSDPRMVQDVNATVSGIAGPWFAEWVSDSPRFEIQFYATGGDFRLLCNDEIVVPTTILTTPGGYQNQLVDWTSTTGRTPRTYRLEASQNLRAIGVIQPLSDSLSATGAEPHTVVWGDSFTEPTIIEGTTSTFSHHQGWPHVMGRALGLRNVFASGSGGTGLLNPGANGRVKLRDRVDAEIALNPARWIVAMGLNDANREASTPSYTAQMEYTEAKALFAYLKQQMPYATGMVISPFCSLGYTSSLLAMRDAIATAAADNGLPFIDALNLNPPRYRTTATMTVSTSGSSLTLDSGGFQAGDAVLIGSPVWTTTPSTIAPRVVTGFNSSTKVMSLDSGIGFSAPIGTRVQSVGRPWSFGTGKQDVPTGLGPSDYLIGSDQTHPTLAGHLKLGLDVARLYRDAAPA